MSKVYVVLQAEDYENTCVTAVFLNKEKAEYYVKLKDEIEGEYYHHYIVERELKDNEIKGNEKVAEYYYYCINSVDSIKDSEDYNDEEDVWKSIDKGETFTDIKEYYIIENNKRIPYKTISAYSKNSFKEAKSLAIKLYKALELTEKEG